MPRVDDAYLEARRREILDAAMTCFSRDGFHRTTMQDIVRETGMSAGALYRYFAGKDEIVAAIAEERRAPDARVLEEASASTDAPCALRELVEGALGRLADPAEQRWRRITVQVWAEALRDERIMDVARKGLDGPVSTVTDVVRRGQEDGALPRELDPVAAARVCASLFYGLVLQQAWDPDVDVDGYVEAVLMVLDAMTGATPRTLDEASPSSGSASRSR